MDRPLILLLSCWWACLPTAWLRAQSLPPAPVTHERSAAHLVADATLHDVVFVDREHGWAVGEQGAIWHTTDGGKSWQLQKSGVDVGLHGVWFLDRNIGWAVGGSTQPYLWTSQAVVLRTIDGGVTWQQQLALLPALNRVKFFDADHGIAWGRGSGGDPLGVFASDDGGRNWRSVAVGPQSAWWGGDFINQRTGVVVGSDGKMARIASGNATLISPPANKGNLRAAQLALDATGWLVGNRGYIARTTDGGTTWNPLDILPAEITGAVNWHAVATHGPHVWIAGSPGSVVLHSPDGGQSWQGHATNSHVPLHKITFVNETDGWAVGDLGTILHTSDGGQTWQTQRRGGTRAAVLMLLSAESELPLATLAKLGKSDGYRTVVHLVVPQQSASEPTAAARLAEALTALGCHAVTHSSNNSAILNPPPQYSGEATILKYSGEGSSKLPDRFLTANNGASLLADIVGQLRLWRPDVIVIPSGDDGDPVAALIASALIAKVAEEAVTQAAAEDSFPHLQAQLALAPWQVSRVFTMASSTLLNGADRGTHRVQAAETVSLSGQTLAELSTAARSLLQRDFQPPAETNEFLLKASLVGEPTLSLDDLAAGLGITPGSENRRPLAISDAPFDPQLERRLAEKRRNVTSILRMNAGNPALLAQVGQMIGDLDGAAAAALLVELAAHFQQAGQIDLSAACQELITRRCQSDPLSDQALVWLLQYYASSETAHASRQVTTEIVRSVAMENLNNKIQPATVLLDAEQPETPPDSHAQRRFTRAVQVAEHIAQTRPLLYSEPQVRVPWAVAQRKCGLPESAERYLQTLAIRYPGESWQECGAAERWLADPMKPAPAKPRVICRFTSVKPQLDGQLNEPFWQGDATTLSENSAVPGFLGAGPNSTILLAHDADFLYLALKCVKSPELKYATETRHRTYDADLAEQDRVQILLDVDRDYTTYFALTVDHRGWTNDACWLDKSWNPKWFVAAGGDAEHWTIEAAIPWGELTSHPPTSGDAWAVAIERVLPQIATQSLTGSADKEIGPAHFGVLIFK